METEVFHVLDATGHFECSNTSLEQQRGLIKTEVFYVLGAECDSNFPWAPELKIPYCYRVDCVTYLHGIAEDSGDTELEPRRI